MLKIEESIRFPVRDDNWAKKTIVGGLLLFVPPISLGYLTDLFEKSMRGEDENLPEWGNWSELFTKGLCSTIVLVSYSFFPLITAIGGIDLIRKGGIILPAVGILLFWVSIVIALAVFFLFPMALHQYVKSGAIVSAFRLEEIISRIRTIFEDYFFAYVVSLGLFIICMILALLFSYVIIGIVSAPFLFFYVLLMLTHMYGRLFCDIT